MAGSKRRKLPERRSPDSTACSTACIGLHSRQRQSMACSREGSYLQGLHAAAKHAALLAYGCKAGKGQLMVGSKEMEATWKAFSLQKPQMPCRSGRMRWLHRGHFMAGSEERKLPGRRSPCRSRRCRAGLGVSGGCSAGSASPACTLPQAFARLWRRITY